MGISTREKPNTYGYKEPKVEPIAFPHKVLALKKEVVIHCTPFPGFSRDS